jgi:hypothetical protein
MYLYCVVWMITRVLLLLLVLYVLLPDFLTQYRDLNYTVMRVGKKGKIVPVLN